jgi:signal transduction histidine kinase
MITNRVERDDAQDEVEQMADADRLLEGEDPKTTGPGDTLATRKSTASMSAFGDPSDPPSRSRGSRKRLADDKEHQVGGPEETARLTAHEIRSHLAVLNGYLSMLEDGSLGRLPEPARASLSPMRAKTRAISRLVDDMLEDVRQRDGRLYLSRRRVDLRSIVRSVADEARFELTDAHRLSTGIPAYSVAADADPNRIATVVRNLINNAIKYSPDGGPIDCNLEVVDDQARITVRDHGIGVDAAEAEQLFGRFQRGRDISNEVVDGVGLGLYISRTLARLHDGDISVSGRPGVGAEFTLHLPLASPSVV